MVLENDEAPFGEGLVRALFAAHEAPPVLWLDRTGVCRRVNDSFLAWLDLGWDAVEGQPLTALTSPVAQELATVLAASRAEGGNGRFGLITRPAAWGVDERFLYSVSCVPTSDAAGQVTGTLVVLQENADPRRVVDHMTHRDRLVTAILDAAVDAIILTDHTGNVLAINRAGRAMFGYEEGELMGQPLTALIPGEELDPEADGAGREGAVRQSQGQRRNGSVFPIRYSLGRGQVGEETVHVAILRDISDRVAAERRVSFLATHDTLTGIYSRGAFFEVCDRSLAPAPDDGNVCAVLFSIDIDQFSDVNEAYGFHAGDITLKTLVGRIGEVLPDTAIVGRIAADEFAALLHVPDPEAARFFGDRLHDRLTAAMFVDHNWLRLRVSIGEAVFDPTVSHS